jgi:drug/metabolite transporter superfamily protein YnfA
VQQPSRRDRARPAELVGLSAVIAGFVAVVVLISTRDYLSEGGPVLTFVAFGGTFIAALLMFAMLALAEKPNKPRNGQILPPDDPPSGPDVQ